VAHRRHEHEGPKPGNDRSGRRGNDPGHVTGQEVGIRQADLGPAKAARNEPVIRRSAVLMPPNDDTVGGTAHYSAILTPAVQLASS